MICTNGKNLYNPITPIKKRCKVTNHEFLIKPKLHRKKVKFGGSLQEILALKKIHIKLNKYGIHKITIIINSCEAFQHLQRITISLNLADKATSNRSLLWGSIEPYTQN